MRQDLCTWWGAHARRVLAGLYLAAALLVLAATLADPLLMAVGVLPERELTLADFTQVDIETVDASTIITASNDAQLILEGGGIRTLWVRCVFGSSPGEFVAFYETRPDAPFSARKMVWARQYGDWYVFRLPYGTTRLRLDPAGWGGVAVRFDEIVLNRRVPPRLATGALFWAALLPWLLFVALDWLIGLWPTHGAPLARALRLRRYRKERKKTPMNVTKDTVIADILNNDPLRESVAIFLSAGMHCLGCAAAHGETVAEACAVHGADADALVEELNAYFAKLAG